MSDERAIEAVLVNYANGLDRRDFEMVRNCFHDDVQAEYSGTELAPGVDAVIRHVSPLRGFRSSLHFIGNIQVAVNGDEADSSCRAIAYLVPGDDPVSDVLTMRALTYDDHWVRTTAGWRIDRRRHVPEWSAQVPVTMLNPHPVEVPE